MRLSGRKAVHNCLHLASSKSTAFTEFSDSRKRRNWSLRDLFQVIRVGQNSMILISLSNYQLRENSMIMADYFPFFYFKLGQRVGKRERVRTSSAHLFPIILSDNQFTILHDCLDFYLLFINQTSIDTR